MSSERRARAGDEAEGSAALSNWLTDTLRPPQPEPVAEAEESAPEEQLAEESEAEEPVVRPSSRVDAWDDGGEHTPLLGSAVSAARASKALAAQPLPAIDFPEASASNEFAAEDPPESEPRADADHEAKREDRALAAAPFPPLSEGEAPPDFDEPDPSALFLADERSARRNQRIAIAALVAFLLLVGGYVLMRGRSSAPEVQVGEAPVAAPATQTPVAAKPAEPAPPESDEAEAPAEEAVPGVKSGFSAALRPPGTPSAEPFIPGGPSTARYPDLPREVLIQLENAATTTAGTEQKR